MRIGKGDAKGHREFCAGMHRPFRNLKERGGISNTRKQLLGKKEKK